MFLACLYLRRLVLGLQICVHHTKATSVAAICSEQSESFGGHSGPHFSVEEFARFIYYRLWLCDLMFRFF